MIIDYNETYKAQYSRLVQTLWPDCLQEEIDDMIHNHHLQTEKILLYLQDDKVVGFLNSAIRNDYVEGQTSSGVGYIEGIYVCEMYRRNNIAYKLVQHLKTYYKSIGIKEIGSDTEIENELSQIFHKAIGFKEVSRNVHFILNVGE